jgi:hypothetical protein
VQQSDHCSAGLRSTSDHRAIYLEMFSPVVLSRMKQCHHRARIWIQAGEICPFEQIAPTARPAEILQFITATMLPRNNMLHVKWPFIGHVGQKAVLAAIARSSPNLLSRDRLHTLARMVGKKLLRFRL